VFVFWFVFHTRIDHWRTMGKRAYWYACLGWPVISLPLLLLRGWIFRVQWRMPWWVVALGFIAAVSAVRVGSQAARVISRRTLFGLVELEPERNPQPVMQTGIYSRTRNPVYLTHVLVIFAAAAISGYAANWLLLGMDLLLISVLIRCEEKELIARYGGEYHDYVRRVPRLIPRWPW
jgi:protein-S-isoprenylcysteine O-methyltransferase Ste14